MVDIETILEGSNGAPLTAKIKVIGVGGAGSNAVEYMYNADVKNVDFIICNTDCQALMHNKVPNKIQLGKNLTKGLGAGSDPNAGLESAKESLSQIEEMLEGADMVFVTAGMGGGTGTGAAPLIAKTAKDKDILTVGVVSIPYRFEGTERIAAAYDGIKRMSEAVDSIIVLNSERLREMYGNMELDQAMSMSDEVLAQAVRGVTEVVTTYARYNVDFADLRTCMKDSGVSLIGVGQTSGDDKALKALHQALSSPIINNHDIRGAKHVIVYFMTPPKESGYGLSVDEISDVSDKVRELTDIPNGENVKRLIWGSGFDESLKDEVRITVIVTGFQDDVFETVSHEPEVKVLEVNTEGNLVEEYLYKD